MIMTDKTEKTTDYRKKFSDALKVCLAESGIATAANLHKETDARGYPVNDSTVPVSYTHLHHFLLFVRAAA